MLRNFASQEELMTIPKPAALPVITQLPAILPTPQEEQRPPPTPQKREREISSERRSQIGTGDRSERIRTYNFPQGRVTDHRIGLTLYKIDSIMDGALDELIDALVTADQAEKLQSSGEA